MEFTGRLTADAEVRKTADKRELVTFTVAVNDSYRKKDGEWVEVAEYFSCAYWLSTKVADSLQKGSIVTVYGRVHLNEYKGKDGNHYANLACHVNGIKIIAGARNKQAKQSTSTTEQTSKDDLPF